MSMDVRYEKTTPLKVYYGKTIMHACILKLRVGIIIISLSIFQTCQSSVMDKEQQKMPLCSTPDVSLTHGPVVTHLQPIDVPLDRPPPPPKRRKSNQSVYLRVKR